MPHAKGHPDPLNPEVRKDLSEFRKYRQENIKKPGGKPLIKQARKSFKAEHGVGPKALRKMIGEFGSKPTSPKPPVSKTSKVVGSLGKGPKTDKPKDSFAGSIPKDFKALQDRVKKLEAVQSLRDIQAKNEKSPNKRTAENINFMKNYASKKRKAKGGGF